VRRPVAVVLVAAVLPLTAAKCAPQGGWRPQLPVKTWGEWLVEEPVDHAIRKGPQPDYGDWIQLGWTHGRQPVWMHVPKDHL